MATQVRMPTGNGTSSAWTALSGGNKWEEVDDPVGTPDDLTSYIHRIGNINTQMFTFAAFSITSSAVALIKVSYRGMESGSVTIGPRLKVNGTEYAGTAVAQDAAWTDFSEDWLTNPDTAAAWTEADVEGTGANPLEEFGVRNGGTTGVEEARVTQIYATVSYTEAGGGGFRSRIAGGFVLNN